jgi:NitT/TauT family transport system substrate-binding protein
MFWLGSLAIMVFFSLLPSWVSAQSKKLEAVKIGYSGVGIAHDLLKIMGNKLIFEKHGLNAQSIYIGSGSLMNQAVVAGSIQFTTSDLPSQIQSALAGIDFKIISVTIDRLDGAIMARKGIRTPQELKGKKIAISRFGSVSDIVTRMVLRHWGLDPKDVVLMQVGNTPTRIAAILSGQVDGGLINPTDVDRMSASGCCILLADLSALDIPYARFGVAGLGSYFKANPDTAARVLQAFTEGIHYYKTHPEDGVAVLRSRGGDPQTAKEIYQKVADSYRTRLDPDLLSIRGVLESLPDERAKKIGPESLIDPAPWDRVAKSGLVERLYGKKESSTRQP